MMNVDDVSFKAGEEKHVDSDLLCYLAHATRWQEFEEFVKCRKDIIGIYPRDRHFEDIANVIAEALKTDWEDSDFYSSLT